jgi:hypothetical protein
MKHLTEEELTGAYYGDAGEDARRHLEECPECRGELARIERLLNEIREYPVPERGESWESEVWTRLAPQLPARKPRREWLRWWILAPAMASLVAVAFIGGMLVQQRRAPAGISAKARERVLLIAMGDHLDRSEMVLAELVNAGPGVTDFDDERARARDLLSENRLLRQTATHTGDVQHAAILDELERVLLDIAHTPPDASAAELETLQSRIESEGLLFKIRVISSNVHDKGQKL